jgi:hypothetical protein
VRRKHGSRGRESDDVVMKRTREASLKCAIEYSPCRRADAPVPLFLASVVIEYPNRIGDDFTAGSYFEELSASQSRLDET